MLPSNATGLERLAAQGLAEIQRVPVRVRELHNPDTCSEDLLPYLAWSRSVDRWDENWPLFIKRQVIKDSHYAHAHKGTVGALRRVIEPIGYIVQMIEWYQDTPVAEPGTFRLEISAYEGGISSDLYDSLLLFIDDAKPASRHLTELTLQLQNAGSIFIGAAQFSGETLTVYPHDPA